MNEKPILKSVAPQFVVADVVRTAEYYRDQLGFNILGYFGEPPVFVMVARDGVEIHFGRADENAPVHRNDSVRRGLGTDAYIWVSDVEALHGELSAKDVEIVEGPTRREYGCTEIVVRDCNGFQLVFADSAT